MRKNLCRPSLKETMFRMDQLRWDGLYSLIGIMTNKVSLRVRSVWFCGAFLAILAGNIAMLNYGFIQRGAFYAGNITLLLFAIGRFLAVRQDVKKERIQSQRNMGTGDADKSNCC